jgi:hypothetical protein
MTGEIARGATFLLISRRIRPERAQNNPDGRQKIHQSQDLAEKTKDCSH